MKIRPAIRALATSAICCALWAACGASAARAQPVVAALAPDSGPAAGATSVNIEGSGFAEGDTVSFAGVPASAIQVISATSIKVVSPPGSGTINVSVSGPGGSSAVVSHDWFAYEPAAGAPWLGLVGNSDSDKGPVDLFARHGIAYDRSFSITAGELPSETEGDGVGGTRFEDRLRYDHEYGMIPVAPIEYRGYSGRLEPDPFFPRSERSSAEHVEGKTTIAEYVNGFLASAKALIELVSGTYPGMPVLLEPMNEPWGYTTPQYDGAQYADVLAQLLPAARAAGIPLLDIYVSAFGADNVASEHGEAEPYAPGWVAAMYNERPSLKTEIAGWYFHPYGPPAGASPPFSWGIESVPQVRRQMASGQNNIIVSEVGYCARQTGGHCLESGASEVETDAEAASRLTEMLDHALPYHAAGWLKALIVYARGDGGWGLQEYPSEKLDQKGEAMIAFAQEHGREPPSGESGGREPPGGESGGREPPGGESGGREPPGGESGGRAPEPEPRPLLLASSIQGLTSTALVVASSPPSAPSAASPIGRASLASGLILVHRSTASLRLRCAEGTSCSGLVRLLVRTPASRVGSPARPLSVAAARYSTTAGVRSIALKLSRRARLLLHRARGQLHVTVQLTEASPATSERSERALLEFAGRRPH